MTSYVEEGKRDLQFNMPPPEPMEKFHDIDVQIAETADEQTDHQAHLGVDQEYTPEEVKYEKAFLRRIDLHIMPLLLVTYGFQVRYIFGTALTLQYADKISLSSGVAFDLTKNAGLVGNDFAWLSTGLWVALELALAYD